MLQYKQSTAIRLRSRAVAALLAPVAVLAAVSPARAEIWTWANTTATNNWSTTGNWTETAGAGAVTGSPPGTAGSTYTGVRLNLNGNLDYTATQGTQTYDIAAAGGENRALAIGATDFNSGKTLTLTGSGANLIFVPETGVAGILIGVGTGTSYAGQATLVVDNGATFKVQTAGGAITGDIAVISRGLATAKGTVTIGGSGTGSLVSADRVTFGTLAAPTAGAMGTLNLNSGGTLLTRQVIASANSNSSNYVTINFNGGTLKSADTDHSETWVSNANALAVSILAGGATFDTNGQNSQTINAVIAGSAGGSLTKSGLGTLILSTTNTYDGATTVSTGTLVVSGSVSGTTAVNVSGGTFELGAANCVNDSATLTMSGGTFSTAGFAESVGAFTLGGTATIDLGSGASIFNLADSNAQTWTGTLSITNWSGVTTGGGTDQLFFGTSASGLTASQVALISFINPAGFDPGTYSASILSTGELVAIPEPGSALSLLGGVGILLGLHRARRRVTT